MRGKLVRDRWAYIVELGLILIKEEELLYHVRNNEFFSDFD